MIDNDIIKALECCSVGTFACSEECPCFHSKSNLKVTSCRFELIGEVLDLINRQKAEIKELKETKDKLLYNLKAVCKEKDEDNIRAEAITEFVERLKLRLLLIPSDALSVVSAYDIDQIAKEMKGEQ